MDSFESILPEILEREFLALREIKTPRDLRASINSISEQKASVTWGLSLRYVAVCCLLIVATFFAMKQPLGAKISDDEFASLVIESELPMAPEEIFDEDNIELERIV